MDTIETKAFHLILHGGNARSCSMEAIDCAKRGEFQEAEAKLQEALNELQEAHRLQTELIQKRGCRGKNRSYPFDGACTRSFNERNYGEGIGE